MIPLRDTNYTRTRPVVTKTLIAINVVVWLYQFMVGATGGSLQAQTLVNTYGVVPYLLTEELSAQSLMTPFTSMFMHGGWMHIISNMWFLWIFGDNVEDALGRKRFVFFYLACGLLAAGAQIAADVDSKVPMVGASGAIAGVLAAYVVLYPRARILTLVPIIIFIHFMELPAYVFIFVWFGFQILSGAMSVGQMGGGVAYFAHIGGFVAGIVMIFLLKKRGQRRRVFHVPRR